MVDYDEGPQLQAAALDYLGHPLYSETVVNKPPLFSWWLEIGFSCLGLSVSAGRLLVLILTTTGFIALGLLAREWWGPGADLTTMTLFLLLPSVPLRAAAVQNDLPAMSLILWALLFASWFGRSGHLRNAGYAGAAFGAALLLHPIVAFMGVVLILALITPREGRSKVSSGKVQGLLVAGATTGLVVVAGILPADIPSMFKWVFNYNLNAGSGQSVLARAQVLMTWWRAHYLLLPLMGVAAGLLLFVVEHRTRKMAGLAVVWFVTTVAFLLSWSPLWPHYAILTAYPLILLAGGGAWEITRGRAVHVHRGRWLLSSMTLGILLAGFLLYRANRAIPWPAWSAEHLHAQSYLKRLTPRGEERPFIVTDNQFLAFSASCLAPPSLADTSSKRIRSGLLTSYDIVRSFPRYRVKGILFDTGRLDQLQGLQASLKALGIPPRRWGSTSFYGLPKELVAPDQPVGVIFGDRIRLEGFSWRSDLPQRGSVLPVLFWKATAPVRESYAVDVRVYDKDGHLITESTAVPFLGLCPTPGWAAGDLIPDPHPLRLPTGKSVDPSQLSVRVVSLATGQPLAILGARGEIPHEHSWTLSIPGRSSVLRPVQDHDSPSDLQQGQSDQHANDRR